MTREGPCVVVISKGQDRTYTGFKSVDHASVWASLNVRESDYRIYHHYIAVGQIIDYLSLPSISCTLKCSPYLDRRLRSLLEVSND